jgi:hypothetical protein
MNIYADTNHKNNKTITTKKLRLVEKAFENESLSLGAKVVFARLLLKHYNNETERCDPSEKTLAADLKISLRQIRRFIKELKDCGWLGYERRFNSSNQYHFNWERTKSVSPMRTNQVSGEDKSGNGRGQNRSFNEDKDGRLTNERTIERTIERTHTESVCDSASPSMKETSSDQDSTISPQESDPLHEENIFSTSHEKGSPAAAAVTAAPASIPGIAVPRGQLGWITPNNEQPLRNWLVSMGLSRHSVDAMRWKAMIECFNDRSNAMIESLKQHQEAPAVNYCPDQDVINAGLGFWQTLMSGDPIITVLRGSQDKGYKVYNVTVLAPVDEIDSFCSLTVRDVAAAVPLVAELQPTRAELAMTYYQLNNRYVSFPCSIETLLSCISQMQKKTKELIDKQTPSSNNEDDKVLPFKCLAN